MHLSDSAVRSCTRLLLVAAAVALPAAVGAQTGVANVDLQRCAAITRAAARLDCFDALVSELARQSPPPVAAAKPAPTAHAAIDAFGSELIEASDVDVPQEIHSRLLGEFTGWRGNTVFRLENGQIWRQAGQGRLVYTAEAPPVTIRRGAFSSYRLSVEGVNSTVRVRRVQ